MEGRGFGTDEISGFFDLPNTPCRTMVFGSTQPLTEMSTRNIPVGKGRPAYKADSRLLYSLVSKCQKRGKVVPVLS
jgi:hypothetical protein